MPSLHSPAIRVLKTGIDVSEVIAQLKQNAEDWNAPAGNGSLVSEWGFPRVSAGVLQLIMGVVRNRGDFVGDSELSVPTKYILHHPAILGLLSTLGFAHVSRCGFLSLPVGGEVGTHIDVGTYYQNRDRYHLSIMGDYEYTVRDEVLIVHPGTLFWFNNKLPHGTKVLGDTPRVTFVFDVTRKGSIMASNTGEDN